MRHRLPQPEAYLEVTDKTVRWRGDASFALDVAEFEAALVDAACTEGARQATLESTVATYGGDLLPGRYDDWRLPEHARLAKSFLDALEQLILLFELRRSMVAPSCTQGACYVTTPYVKPPAAILCAPMR